MLRQIGTLSIGLWIAVHTPVAADDERVGDQQLPPIQAATRDLIRELERLQTEVAAELSEKEERRIYRQADSVLAAAESFEATLKPGPEKSQILKEFEKLDQRLHGLIKDVRALKSGTPSVQRSTARLSAADDELHFVVAVLKSPEDRIRALVERQSGQLAASTRQLQEIAAYALAESRGREVLLSDLSKFAEAATRFHEEASEGPDLSKLRGSFQLLTEAWERAIRGLEDLKPAEYRHLLRSAARVDRFHERLFRLLEIAGERPKLTIRT